MKGWMLGVGAALVLLGGPAFAHKEKRTDTCGCHHQWGLRHCHPKKKTARCEAPVSKQETAEREHDRTPAQDEAARPVDL